MSAPVRHRPRRIAAACCAGLLAVAASGPPESTNTAAPAFDEREVRAILRLSPLPAPPSDPSNVYAADPGAAGLGERLFFDARLSATGAMSCASCHDPARAWSDGRRSADAEARFPRNVPGLRNSAHNRWYNWDGRADSAWSQALGPLESEREMNGNRLAMVHLIAGDPSLRDHYVDVFGPLPEGIGSRERFPAAARPIPGQREHPLQRAWAAMAGEDRRAATAVFIHIGKALAAFERTLAVGESPFDRFAERLKAGQRSAAGELSPAAARGAQLFVGRGQCTLCHSGPNLSDGEFHDVGIALGDNHRVDPGRHRGVLALLSSPFTRAGDYADGAEPAAPIRFLETQTDQLGSFKTPTLRGVAETAPYMHDGRFDTLEQVVRFYSTRDGASPLGHPTTLLQPLRLSDGEIADLVAFLESLSAAETGGATVR